VKHGFVDRFGRSGLWWFALIVASAAVLLWEVGVKALRTAWWPTEVEIFQELEKDKVWKKRFEEVSRGEDVGRWKCGEDEDEQ
jgi:phospholipid-translocating ATPase